MGKELTSNALEVKVLDEFKAACKVEEVKIFLYIYPSARWHNDSLTRRLIRCHGSWFFISS